MLSLLEIFLVSWLGSGVVALRFDQQYVGYNLNENETAVNPLDYYGAWTNHTYHPSPSNWRFPVYTIFLDKFVNGDPSNDDINGTVFEHDIMQTQLRHGGDIQGVIDSLDYIQGMGIKGLYVAGSPFINQPWGADSYSPLDLTLLDMHYGNITKYREMVTEIHKRGMYLIADNTMATMGDLNAFVGYLNSSAPFSLGEHEVIYRDPMRQYFDFRFSNEYNETCVYPRFWNETGYLVDPSITAQMQGCYNSEFDQYGDTEAFGVHPDYQRQLSKFASVQDRLREWVPSVRDKIKHLSCLTILMLDVDGFRIDKATQVTVDALGDFSDSIRECARSVGKENFFIPGEITGGNNFGSIYLGRGRQPDMTPPDLNTAVALTNASSNSFFIRTEGQNALDAAAFHYSIYRSLTRFLGMSGNLESGYDTPIDFVDAWNDMLLTNDLVNPNTNVMDVRHMYGVSNQDVFRWPAINNGIEKQLLGMYITTLHMPGIPLVLWGEEQNFYVLDNTATNYLYGRQAMSAATAWQTHGCYSLNGFSDQYFEFPINAALAGCHDTSNILDHRDPSHPTRNLVKAMYQMRENYPVLNDGLFLQRLSNQTRMVTLAGSSGTETELGMWSTLRSRFPTTQDLSGSGQGNQSVWLVYQNDNATINYQFNCSDNTTALIAPFDSNTTVKNLFYPYEELTLETGPVKLGLEGSLNFNGCLKNITLNPWAYKAFVPKDKWVGNGPMLTKFLPGHDARLQSTVAPGRQETVQIQLHFSAPMDCQALASNLELSSSTEDKRVATLDNSTVICANVTPTFLSNVTGSLPTVWTFTANLTNVSNGVHSVTVRNASTSDGSMSTGTTDTFLFRTGQTDNPVVFPQQANYTLQLLHQSDDGSLFVSHKAAGADFWRYSLDWTHFSNWMPYTGGNDTLQPKNWTGTTAQAWESEHLIVQYHNVKSGSSDYIQHADLPSYNGPARRFPHLFAEGPFNQYGYDAGLQNSFTLVDNGIWHYHYMTEWPSVFQINEWGVNPDGFPDQTGVFGDVDGDGVVDRVPPSSLSAAVFNMSLDLIPSMPFLGYNIILNDATYQFSWEATGNAWIQIAIFIISAIVPVITGAASIWAFMRFFYAVKHNEEGITDKKSILPLAIRKALHLPGSEALKRPFTLLNGTSPDVSSNALNQDAGAPRRSVLIATMEYDIEDWKIKIKIGGLGVMAQLMGKNLGHQDLIWVVPCVGDVDYPIDERAEPMYITILGDEYEVKVQYHKLRNITYVLLDAPVFRAQTKAVPYPARMDDLDSAVYYSSWNQCIALALRRFHVDLYHINDYHGAVAPLHLLPERIIPVCLSLHNAEFQGLWPLRTAKEFKEVCEVFNLKPELVQKYVQFGDVFNLLHAGSSYLRLHQRGFGAVGVSKKYGARSHARYPIFWGLNKVGHLPNPDPTDLADWNGIRDNDVVVDEEFETGRPELKRQAQEWAGLDLNPQADLLVFVGRWSMQKGIDLIADVMPSVLEDNPNVQLICVGPVIDLYGKFAALKLDIMMKKYKGRVFSKPEFTMLPPYIFSGAEFALIPSRDEPFGLVAVEFGRKGALGIGARVGGLGNMPGWWYTVESTTTSHLLHQFKVAIKDALASKNQVRRIMRAKSAKQRFPVAVWVSQLEALQSNAIKMHEKEALKNLTRPASGRGRTTFLPSFHSYSRSNSRNPSSSRAREESRAEAEQTNDTSERQNTTSPDFEIGPAGSSSGSSSSRERNGSDSNGTSSRRNSEEWTLRNTSNPDLLAVPPQFPYGTPMGDSLQATPLALPSSDTETPAHQPSLMAVEGQNPTSDYFGHSSDVRFAPRVASVLSMNSIVGEKKDFLLQKVDPDFTDSRGDYYKAFEKQLGKLSGNNSEVTLCIEQYLVRSEREWYGQFRAAKLGRYPYASTPTSSLFRKSRPPSITGTITSNSPSHAEHSVSEESEKDQWLLGDDYKPPRGIKLFMQRRIGDWPIYSLFLALGQIIAANSYQITLLSGTIGQTADKLYITACIYLGTSLIWWFMLRSLKSVYVLSIPFFFYGLAFLLLGVAPFANSAGGRGWIQNVATGMYATASSSGSIYFALNFGDEGGAPVKSWTFRACIIQGTQQIYVCALWAWGDYITKLQATGATFGGIITTTSTNMAEIAIPIAVLLWVIGIVIFAGLPDYYRQAPGKVPSFYLAMFRRKIVLWFFVVVIIQNYFLSSSTGRNWQFLWSSQHAAVWQVALLAIFFFIFVWIGLLWLFGSLSKSHSWILPMFAIGLGAPRWAQILWSCSNIGFWLPWTHSPLASALTSRALWLWLGTLDALQGVGFGMILLQTLARLHITYTLIAAQVLGSLATIAARATAPNRIGPGDLFPDFTQGIYPGAGKAWFWVGLVFQLLICTGFFRFFRKEQLSKP